MNSKEMIWAYFIMLSDHFAYDPEARALGLYLPKPFKEENRIDLDTWDETIRFLGSHAFNTVLIDLGDQVRYESHPEISAPNAFSKEFVEKKLDEIRALGMKPVPKLNFSACHDVWLKEYSRMIGTKEYYRVCADLIAEVCELFGGPELFHLGLDEENYDCQQHTRERVMIRSASLWWHDCFFYFNEAEKNGARPWVWSDYYVHHPKLFLENMPKSVLQSNWYYKTFRNLPPVPEGYELPDSGYFGSPAISDRLRQDAYGRLSDAGYDEVPTSSSYTSRNNQLQTMMLCKEQVAEEHLKGFLTASWYETWSIHRYSLLEDAFRFYEARRTVYPESL